MRQELRAGRGRQKGRAVAVFPCLHGQPDESPVVAERVLLVARERGVVVVAATHDHEYAAIVEERERGLDQPARVAVGRDGAGLREIPVERLVVAPLADEHPRLVSNGPAAGVVILAVGPERADLYGMEHSPGGDWRRRAGCQGQLRHDPRHARHAVVAPAAPRAAQRARGADAPAVVARLMRLW